MIYEHVETLTPERGATRIFAPVAYRAVRETQFAPVVHIEALSLAAWFPLCWDMRGGRPRLVVLRSLLGDGVAQPPGSPQQSASLPLALQAYPFVVGPVLDTRSQPYPALIDRAIADQPTDVGAPILMTDGRLGVGAQMRLRAAAAFDDALRLTDAMTDELAKRELFEPWPLRFDLGGDASTAIEGMSVVRAESYGSEAVSAFIRAFGQAGAMLLGAHQLSLFRAGVLLQRARAHVAAGAAATAPA